MMSSMIASDSSFYNIGMGAKADVDELSDEDGNDDDGAERSDSHMSNSDEDYFKGILSHSFIAGCQPSQEEMKNAPMMGAVSQSAAAQNAMQAMVMAPKDTYFDRCKSVGRLGPPKTELDRSSAYGEYEFGHERMDQRSTR